MEYRTIEICKIRSDIVIDKELIDPKVVYDCERVRVLRRTIEDAILEVELDYTIVFMVECESKVLNISFPSNSIIISSWDCVHKVGDPLVFSVGYVDHVKCSVESSVSRDHHDLVRRSEIVYLISCDYYQLLSDSPLSDHQRSKNEPLYTVQSSNGVSVGLIYERASEDK